MDYISRRARLIPRDRAPLAQLLRGRCYAVDETVPVDFHDGARSIGYTAILFTVSGTSAYVVDGRRVRITPGSLLVLPPRISFSERVEEDCHNRYLMLNGPLADEVVRVVRGGERFAFWPECPPPVAASLARCVVLALARPDVASWELGSEICRLVGLLLASDPALARGRQLAGMVLAALGDAPGEPWKVGALAKRLGMSESAFAHRFRLETGIPPAAFIRKARCDAGRVMLEAGLSVSGTAASLGFANPYHFSRVFKQVAGISPSACIPALRRLRRQLSSPTTAR